MLCILVLFHLLLLFQFLYFSPVVSLCCLKSIAIATICSFFLYVSSTHSLRINMLSKIFPPLVNPACSNFSILFLLRVSQFLSLLVTLVSYMTRQSLLLVSVLFLLVCSILVSLLFLIFFSNLLVLVFEEFGQIGII